MLLTFCYVFVKEEGFYFTTLDILEHFSFLA